LVGLQQVDSTTKAEFVISTLLGETCSSFGTISAATLSNGKCFAGTGATISNAICTQPPGNGVSRRVCCCSSDAAECPVEPCNLAL
jgi:hypothetical protein